MKPAVEPWWVPVEALSNQNVQEHLRPHVERFVAYSHGRWTIDELWEDALAGQVSILTAILDGEVVAAAGLKIEEFRSGLRLATVVWCSGEGHKAWQHLIEDIIKRAKAHDCHRVIVPGRRGWLRYFGFLGFKERHVMAELELSHG